MSLKKIIGIFCLLGIIFGSSSCTNYDELNTDPTRLTDVNPGSLLNPILYNMASYNWSKYNGFTFELMQLKVSTSSTSGYGWYYMSDNSGDGQWSTSYRWLNNIRKMREESKLLNVSNYDAVGLTLEAWIYEQLAESFGNIPMSEACDAGDGNYTPKFDTQKQVFSQIIAKLDSANKEYDTSVGLEYNSGGELLYGTDASLTNGVSAGIAKWKKFNNSLRMRVLLRLLNVDGFDAKNKLTAMANDTITYPVFSSNNDEAKLHVTGVSPLLAPMTRPSDFTAYLYLSKFFIDSLNVTSDPRRTVFAQTATNNKVKGYYGLPSGYSILPSINASAPNKAIATAPMDIVFMPYSEVLFIKTELIQRGIVPGDAKDCYQKAVTASMLQWGVVPQTGFFNNSSAAYNGTLNRIMEQKFIALFFVDYQQWYEYNRTGMPNVPVGDGVPVGNVMPDRFKYPSIIQRTNMSNYAEAVTGMGGTDGFYVKLIWQK